VLANGEALVTLLSALEDRFNGHVFILNDADRESLRHNGQLARFARLVEGRTELSGQLTLWQLYSFRDLPVEVTDKESGVVSGLSRSKSTFRIARRTRS
jgi:hypothetical protein